MNDDDDDVSCAKRCKEKRKSQYPTLNLHVLGLYMYVYLQLQLNSICAYSSSSSLFMIWLLIDYERMREDEKQLIEFSFFSLAAAIMVVCAYIYYIYYCRVLHIIMFAACFHSLVDFISFRFVFFSCMHHIIIDGWIMPNITWAVENSLIMTRLN